MGVCTAYSNSPIAQYVLTGFVGALLGVFATFTVNCTLVEISINGFFAVYFGITFMLIATIIFWRVCVGSHPRRAVLLIFSSLVFAAGLLCFFLQKDWFVHMHWFGKVPVYSLLGIAVTFALFFAVVDLLNYCSGQCCIGPQGIAKSVVESEGQVTLVVCTAIALGFFLGLVFGFVDLQSEQVSHIRVSLIRENMITFPIGALIVAVAAMGNRKLGEKATHGQYAYDPLKDDALDDEDF